MKRYEDKKLEEKLEEGKLEESYYSDELKNLLPIDEYGIKMVLHSSSGKTKFLSLNAESFKDFNDFIKKNKVIQKTK